MSETSSVHRPSGRDWLLVAVFAIAYVLSGVDRQILAFVTPAVKRDLALSDVQIGILQGFAFALFYAVAGLPMGWLIDRFPRTRVMGLALIFWSGMTALCGAAPGFAVLAVARMGVGAGEAALTPGAYSMMAERFPPRLLGRASLIYALGAPVSLAVAAALSGYLLRAGGESGLLCVPIVGAHQAWRVAFVAAAVPGVLVGLALLTRRDPRPPVQAAVAGSSPGLWPFLRRHGRSHVLFAVASTAIVAVHYAVTAWSPAILSTAFHWSPAAIASSLGTVGMVGGIAGCLLGSVIADRLIGRGTARAPLVAMLGVATALLVLALLCRAATSPHGFVALVGAILTLTSLMLMLMPTYLQTITPAGLRGRMTAFYLLMSVGVGAGSGPALVGAVSSYAFLPGHLQSALAMSAGLFAGFALMIFMLTKIVD